MMQCDFYPAPSRNDLTSI